MTPLLNPNAPAFLYTVGSAGTAAVTDVSSQAVARNLNRRGLVICNIGAGDVYLGIGVTAQAQKGILLKASGGSYEMNASNLCDAAVNAICDTGLSTTLTFSEGT